MGMRGNSTITRIAELGLVVSMILSACVAPAGAASRGSEDRSQDQAERTRSLIGMAAQGDTSYDQVEQSRGTALSSAANADTSYDQVERSRSLVVLAGKPDTSYDQVERSRGGAFGQ